MATRASPGTWWRCSKCTGFTKTPLDAAVTLDNNAYLFISFYVYHQFSFRFSFLYLMQSLCFSLVLLLFHFIFPLLTYMYITASFSFLICNFYSLCLSHLSPRFLQLLHIRLLVFLQLSSVPPNTAVFSPLSCLSSHSSCLFSSWCTVPFQPSVPRHFCLDASQHGEPVWTRQIQPPASHGTSRLLWKSQVEQVFQR